MYFTLATPNNSFMESFFLISLGREGQKINMSSFLEKWVDGGKGHTHYKNTISPQRSEAPRWHFFAS